MGSDTEREDGSAEEPSEPSSEEQASAERASSSEAPPDADAEAEAEAPPDADAEAEAPKKKRRKKRSKKRATATKTKRAAASDGDDAAPPQKKRKKRKKRPEPGEGEGDTSAPQGEDEPKRRIPWLALILAVAAVELFLFGSRGRIEVCVAKEGVHDFALMGTPRTDENTARYPSCETRLNIGMKSHFDDLKTDAVVHACRRANIFRGKEAILTCAVEADGWQHRVEADFVMPWEPEYRKRLFWFLE